MGARANARRSTYLAKTGTGGWAYTVVAAAQLVATGGAGGHTLWLQSSYILVTCDIPPWLHVWLVWLR